MGGVGLGGVRVDFFWGGSGRGGGGEVSSGGGQVWGGLVGGVVRVDVNAMLEKGGDVVYGNQE